MDYSSSDETHTNETPTNESQTIEGKKKIKQKGDTMMAKLKKVCNPGNKLLIEFNDITWTFYGPNSSLFRSCCIPWTWQSEYFDRWLDPSINKLEIKHMNGR